jgi:hypothetical protein
MKPPIALLTTLGMVAVGALTLLPARRVARSPALVSPSTRSAPSAHSAASLGAAPSSPDRPAPLPASHAIPQLPAEEAAFMTDLRVLAELDPELCIERAREGKARFGDSADAPERRSLLIHALARVGRPSDARAEAEHMVNECPDSAWVHEIERFTGAHRHRNIRLASNGQLEFE